MEDKAAREVLAALEAEIQKLTDTNEAANNHWAMHDLIPIRCSEARIGCSRFCGFVKSQKSTGNWILLSTATSDGIQGRSSLQETLLLLVVGVSGRIKLVLSQTQSSC
jgi:hypothetical protein